MNNNALWKRVLDVVRISVSAGNFSAWFSQTSITDILPNKGHPIVQVGCPSLFVQETLERRYRGLLQDALNQVTGKKNDLVFVIQATLAQKSPAGLPSLLFAQNEFTNNQLRRANIPERFSFDNFAVSPTNQLAWSATTTVAKNPGTAYNPLFIWGGVGVGKTHLATACAREILTRFPDKKVLCSTGDEFIVGIIDAIRTRTTSEFKKKYRRVDVLVIDDIAFIAGKDTVQDEFFHTFNVIQKEGGQIILTSDRAPHEINRLEPRLQSRFQGGLVVDISPPDFELRVAILLIKARERGLELPLNLSQKIAEVITGARQLEGFLVQLDSRSNRQNLPLTETLIEEMLKLETKNYLNGELKKIINQKDIVACVCDYFSTTRKLLSGVGRKKTLVTPRHILMYLLRTELKLPYEEIGRILGGRDHTTVIHGVNKIENQISFNEDVQRNILGIKSKLWG